MTQEQKHELLVALCGYLPYKAICNRFESAYELVDIDIKRGLVYLLRDRQYVPYSITSGDEIKPYLRPMSSMTEEERLELSKLTDDKFKFYLYTTKPEIVCYEKYNYLEGLKVLDWLNAHHFDYRGLIPKGLALEAPEGMYFN